MNQKTERLEQLRAQLHIKLKAKDFLENQISPFKEIHTYLRQERVAFTIIDLLGIREEWLTFIGDDSGKTQFPELVNSPGKSDAKELVTKLFAKYPSENAFRFVPQFDKITPNPSSQASGLKDAVQRLALENQTVYLYYLQYAPLLQLQLADLIQVANEDLFNFYYGDVVIFPENHSWLISYSLEEEWYAGRKNSQHQN